MVILDNKKQQLEQYFSSEPLADMMALMMDYNRQAEIRILDPGAGAGSLFLACVKAACSRGAATTSSVSVVAYEIDPSLSGILDSVMRTAKELCSDSGVSFSGRIICGDIISDYAKGLIDNRFTHVIANPPYKKIRVGSPEHVMLNRAGIPTTNEYAAFVDISCAALAPLGQISFISPRSFCNGMYFRKFRERFLDAMSIKRIHLFESRTSSFSDDGVLQENIIVSARKGGQHPKVATISSSTGPRSNIITSRRVPVEMIVHPKDSHMFIHIPTCGQKIAESLGELRCTLDDLGICVSTGKVIDFRARTSLRFSISAVPRTVPLVRPFNISGGVMQFPLESRHPNYVVSGPGTLGLLVPNGHYVVLKRFTTREERKRLVAAVWKPDCHNLAEKVIGFENRTNFFHSNGSGLDPDLADGLWAFLNSSIVDLYIRQFNGNTQINATDLRYLRYPAIRQLKKLGSLVDSSVFNQDEIDKAVKQVV